MSETSIIPRPGDPRSRGNPPSRPMSSTARRGAGPGSGPSGASTGSRRHWSCATGQVPVMRQGRPQACGQHPRPASATPSSHGGRRPAGLDRKLIDLDGTADRSAWVQRAARRVAWRQPTPRAGSAPCPPYPILGTGTYACPVSHDEHQSEWRGPRRQQHRLPGFMILPVGAGAAVRQWRYRGLRCFTP